MSKIGRKPIALGNTQLDVKGQEVHFKGSKGSGVYVLSDLLTATVRDGFVVVLPKESAVKDSSRRELNQAWGLNRALLANKIQGASTGFEKKVQIVGLGFKAVLSGSTMVFSLGYSHKIDFVLPEGVSVDIDKSGQSLTFKSTDKELVGHVCSRVRSLRLPEPYKGTGIKLATEIIARKAGKAKASS